MATTTTLIQIVLSGRALKYESGWISSSRGAEALGGVFVTSVETLK